AGLTEVLGTHPVLDEPEQHAETGGGEAPVVVDLLPEGAADERSHDGAQVDAHVEDGEARIPPDPEIFCCRSLRVLHSENTRPHVVQLADDARDVWLEQPGAHDDEEQPREKGGKDWQTDQGSGEGEVTRGDDASADENRTLLTPELVGDPSAGKGEQVDQRGVEAVDGGRGGDVHSQAGIR